MLRLPDTALSSKPELILAVWSQCLFLILFAFGCEQRRICAHELGLARGGRQHLPIPALPSRCLRWQHWGVQAVQLNGKYQISQNSQMPSKIRSLRDRHFRLQRVSMRCWIMKLHRGCVHYFYFIIIARRCTCCFQLNHLCLRRAARGAKALVQVNGKDKIWCIMCYWAHYIPKISTSASGEPASEPG